MGFNSGFKGLITTLFKLAYECYADDWLTHNFINTGILKWLLLLIIEATVFLITLVLLRVGKVYVYEFYRILKTQFYEVWELNLAVVELGIEKFYCIEF